MNNVNGKHKFQVGQRIRVRRDLIIGFGYSNHDGTRETEFTEYMTKNRGKIVEILEIRNGRYLVSNDEYNLYSDEMLSDLTETDDARFAKADYVHNDLVEAMVNKLMHDQFTTAIDHALDSRMHVKKPKAFEKLLKQRDQYK